MLKNILRKKKRPVIIGVHGLGNKPPKALLVNWWKWSLTEGLRKIKGKQKGFNFKMAYWADLMYEKPLNPKIKDPEHELHIEEPYIAEPIPSPKIRHTFWHYWKLVFDGIKEKVFLSRNGLANYRVLFDMVVRSEFKDLAAYYETPDEDILETEPFKQKIRQRLKYLLRKYKDHKILIVSHSMGSLVAYDVLSEVPNQYEIEVFISMGSPIGLPVLREKMAKEMKIPFEEHTILPTPDNVKNWYNFSDEQDHFAVFDDLSNYYSPNKNGVAPIDYIVDNDYKDWVTNNAHKSFGYLRTPELAKIIAEYIGQKETIWQKGRNLLKKKK
ncbi:MAG: hypothetical protein JXR07_00365 [Reichenbachiella sp.]